MAKATTKTGAKTKPETAIPAKTDTKTTPATRRKPGRKVMPSTSYDFEIEDWKVPATAMWGLVPALETKRVKVIHMTGDPLSHGSADIRWISFDRVFEEE